MVTDQSYARAFEMSGPGRYAQIERHRFVPETSAQGLTTTSRFRLAKARRSPPYIVALMTELLALQGKEKVLEIGTAAAIKRDLAELAAKFSIEILKSLAERAKGC